MADHLSPREAALRLGISYPTMKQWLYRGKVKAVKTPGGHYRISEAELDTLLPKAGGQRKTKRQAAPAAASGRNQLLGRVVEVRTEGLLALVRLSIGGQVLTSLLPAETVRELQLEVGGAVTALIQPADVMLLRV